MTQVTLLYFFSAPSIDVARNITPVCYKNPQPPTHDLMQEIHLITFYSNVSAKLDNPDNTGYGILGKTKNSEFVEEDINPFRL